MSDNEQNKAPIGSGHAAAMARLGLQELRNAFYNGSNIAQQQSEYGLYGKSTPGEVAASRQPEFQEPAREMDEERGSILDKELEKAQARDFPEREPKVMDRD